VLAEERILVPEVARRIVAPADASSFARSLYASLRELDSASVDVILVAPPSSAGLGLAVIDRLTRAAAPRPAS
jgi:L-threonylcarbamoyladenylate synthase